jgi:thiosulfate dehydrogenase
MSHEPQARGMGVVIALCAAIGTTTVISTLAAGHAQRANGVTAEYGQRLIAHTTEYLGPDVTDAGMRFMSSRLACASCHIGAGKEPGNLSLVAAMSRYPRISPRSGGKETIEDRINGCMVRSMNGRTLPMDGPEMIAMVAWLRFLADRAAAMGADERKAHDPSEFKTPNRAADPEAGERVFGKRCAACHGKEGAGLPASAKLIDGYLFPPLWGSESFNDGAGLHRVLTAARFVKAKMPVGRADLTDDEAFDVAAFINSKPRPHMANPERDYPDRSKKPVDTSYPPYADSFPVKQHLLGPFAPIEKYYKEMEKASR